MDVVEAIIEVGDEELLARLNGNDVVFVDAVAEAQGHGLWRNGPLFLRMAGGDDDEDIGKAIVLAGDEKASGHGTGMFGGALGVHPDEALSGTRADEDGPTGNASVGKAIGERAIGDDDG